MATKEELDAEVQENYRLVAALLSCLVRELKDTGAQVEAMDAFGVSTANIAKALGINEVSVRTTRHRQGRGVTARKKPRARKKTTSKTRRRA